MLDPILSLVNFMEIGTQFMALEQFFKKEKYFEVIIVGIQFIDLFCDKIFKSLEDEENEYINENAEVVCEYNFFGINPKSNMKIASKITETPHYTINEWKNTLVRLRTMQKKDFTNWKQKISAIFLMELQDPGFLFENIKINQLLLSKIEEIYSGRNNLSHGFFISSNKNDLKKIAFSVMQVCELYKKCHRL